MGKKTWEEFEDYICGRVQELDPKAKRNPGSGNKGRKGDVSNSIGLMIECKAHTKKNVYTEDDIQKIIEEVPLHSSRIAVLFTRNKDGKMRAHLDADTFLDLYIDYIKHMERCGEWDL